MKTLIILFFTVAITFSVSGQYYYNDIISNQKLNSEYAALKLAGFNKVVLESFEQDDSPSDGFFCEKKFNTDFSESVMISRSLMTDESSLQAFYKDGKIFKSVTQTPFTTNTMTYTYHGDKLSSVGIETFDDRDSTVQKEERVFLYDSAGLLTELNRLKNGVQISSVRFEYDEAGNVIEEIPVNGNADRKYYYYYDDQNRLTDVVHFNELAQKLLPDYMFVYDEKGLAVQMISVDENARDYNIWRYSYTNRGLPEIQKCFSKDKKLLGTIQFEYSKL